MPRGSCAAALLAALAAGALLLPAPAGAAAPPFADVPPGNWAAPAIDGLAAAGLIQGVAPGLFDPGAPETRAGFAALLAAVRGLPPGVPGPSFGDVPAGAWYAPAVEAVAGEGWMEGSGNGAFDPDGQVTRAAAAAALVASLGLSRVAADSAGAPCPASDCASIPTWARGSMAVAVRLGLLQGDAGGRLLPAAPLTRAEAAVLLWRLRNLPPGAVAAAAAPAAATVYAAAGATALEAGGPPVRLQADAHDAAGYLLPCAYVWHVAGPATLEASGGTAAVRADGTGPVRVTVAVAGAPAVAATVALRAFAAARLDVAGLPPAGLRGAAFPVTVTALQASGAPDPAPAAEVQLRVRGAGGGAPDTALARAEGGRAEVSFPPLPPGRYTVTLIWPGLPAVSFPYRALVRPEGRLTAATLPPALTVGGTAEILAGTAVPGTWPVAVAVSGLALGPPPLAGDPPPPAVLRVRLLARAVAGGGAPLAVATAAAAAPGPARVRVSVPGGALRAVTLRLPVDPAGALEPAGPQRLRAAAGTPVTVEAAVTGSPGAVSVEPVDPAGHPLPAVPATTASGLARATFTPRQAGIWRLLWLAPGAVPAALGSVDVVPGPPAALVLDATPSSFVQAGRTVTLRAWLADAQGNPVPAPFRLRVGGGGAAAGSLGPVRGALSGPGAFASFRGTAPGRTVLVATSPDHPGLPPARLVLTTLASPAAAVAGPGIWVTFPDWKAEGTAGVLAAAREDHATHIYFEVATSDDGFYGGRGLDALLPAAHAAGIAVLAWIYPALQDVPLDLAILQSAATYRTPGGDAADGLALDIEDRLTPGVVAAYARAAARLEGPRGLVVGVTWAPQQMPGYPYAALAPYVGAFAPMDYWHTRQEDYSYAQVYAWVRASVRELRRAAGRPAVPVDVIAQTFDWFSPVTGRGLWSPSALELQAAIAAAADAGAAGISFYRPSTATRAEQAVMAAVR